MLRIFFALFLSVFFIASQALAKGDPEKGEYLLKMGGCVSCHKTPNQKNAELAGGHALKTPFGTFYVPNITPDRDTGIGGWSDDDFITAMTKGIAPDGSHYYPAFPYTSYTKMKRQDLLDLKAFLNTVPAVKNHVPDHDLQFPFNLRILMAGWKIMFFNSGEYQDNPEQNQVWNRGAYIVQAGAHCGECHTPRNIFGGLDHTRMFAGNSNGPDKENPPPMIPQKWNVTDFFSFLKMGMTPDGDFAGGSMGHVISNTTSRLNREDLKAVIAYLTSFQ